MKVHRWACVGAQMSKGPVGPVVGPMWLCLEEAICDLLDALRFQVQRVLCKAVGT